MSRTLRECMDLWDKLGAGYPGEGPIERAVFDVLAPIRPGWGTRSPIFEFGKETTPDPEEVWDIAVESAASVRKADEEKRSFQCTNCVSPTHCISGMGWCHVCMKAYKFGYSAAVDSAVRLVEYEGALTPNLRTKFQRLIDFGS